MPVFREIADEVQAAVAGVWGRPEARPVQGRGAGGDGTVFIDSLAERIVLARLELEHDRGRRFHLISEEAGERDYGRGEVVVVDPIDGSHNAKMGIPYFSLTLAVGMDRTLGGVREGVVRNLVTGDHYEARRGAGASLNGAPISTGAEDGAGINVLQVEATRLLDHLEEYRDLLGRAEKIRMLGSAALNICLVAAGAISVSVAPSLRSVDCAAPLLVLAEAGGAAADNTGAELSAFDMGLDTRPSVVAAASRGLLQSALASLGPGTVR